MPLPSIAGDIPLDQAGSVGGPTPGAAAPLGFFDRFKLGMQEKRAGPDWGFNQMDWRENALDEVRDALRKRGIEPVDPSTKSDALPGESGAQMNERHFRQMFAQVARVRQSDHGFLPDYLSVVDRSSFDGLIKQRRTSSLAEVNAQAPDGLGAAGFLGGALEGFKDPLSWLPIGGPELDAASSIGGRIIRQAITGAAINAGTTTVLEPLVRADAARIGQKRTAGDFVTDLLASTAIGGGLGGTAEGVHIGVQKLFGERPAPVAPAAEPAARETPTTLDNFDERVANAFADVVPPEQRTPDEQAAIHAIRRNAEVKASSPFVPGPAGDDAHVQALDRGMAAIHNPEALPQRGAAKPIARETIAAPDDVAGTRMPGRELLKAKIHSVEAPHGGPNLAGGSAFGPYQFEPRTWVSLFKRRYPGDSRSFGEIAALREDPHLNDVLINDLISENAAALRHAGFEENAGNLYLAHVLGHDRAVTVLRADPHARLGDLLPEGYFKGNPFKRDDSAAGLVHWAYGKMGDKGLPAHIAAAPDAPAGAAAIESLEGPATAIPTGRFDVEALYGDVGMADRPVLNPEHFASPEEHAAAQVRFERSSDAADGYVPVMSRAEAFAPAEHFSGLRDYRGTVTAEAIGEKLGITPDEAVRAVRTMQSLDRKSPFVLARERGAEPGAEPTRIMRRPRQVKSLIQFLADKGGINDAGGDLKSMDADVGRRFRKPLINNESGMGIDDALSLAIEHDYFPELNASRTVSGGLAADTQILRDAIDAELRGEKRLPVDQLLDNEETRQRALAGREEPIAPEVPSRMTPEELASRADPEAIAQTHLMAEQRGVQLSDEEAIEVEDRFENGERFDDALFNTVMAAAARDAEEFAALSGDLSYGDVSHEWETYVGEHPEIRGDGEPDLRDGAGERRSAPAEGGEGASREALAAAAHDPEKRAFGDPTGVAAEAQADSLVHDLQMEPPAEGDATTYRIGEEGGDHDLASILDEIEQAQKAAAEMRNCLKPKGGDE